MKKCFFTECDIKDVLQYIIAAFEDIDLTYYFIDTWRVSLHLYKIQSHRYKFFVEREINEGLIGETSIIIKEIDSQNAFKFCTSDLVTTNKEYSDREIISYLTEMIND